MANSVIGIEEAPDGLDGIGIILDNMKIPADRMKPCLNSISANIAELASLAAEICKTKEDMLLFLSDFAERKPQNTPRDFTGKALVSASLIGRLELFRMIGIRFETSNPGFFDLLFGKPEQILQSSCGKIAYVKNLQTDSAYLAFSQGIDAPKAVYFHSFTDVCEEVYNGICEFCILPIENSDEGRLNSFYTLIDKYDLHICSVSDIPSGRKGNITRFALIRKNSDIDMTIINKNDGCLEISVAAGRFPTLADLLDAAAFCGMSPSRINSYPNGQNGEYTTSILFPLSNADVRTFLLFLSFDFPHCNVIGIYKKVKNK